jgi:hypothetical protein
MIIFGTRARTKIVGEGEFFCPSCRGKRRYQHKEGRPYFALYFIPIFPVGEGRSYVECQTCGTAFDPAVLQMEPPARKAGLAEQLNTIRERLEQGAPVEYVVRDLTTAGLDFDVARGTVESQVGAGRKVCNACGLAYVSSVNKCAVCQGPLQAHAVGHGEPSPAQNDQPLTKNDGGHVAKNEAHAVGHGEPSPAQNDQPLTRNDSGHVAKNEAE